MPNAAPMFQFLMRFAALSLLVATSAHSQQPSRLDDVVRRGTLRVGMTGDYLPFTYLDRQTSKFRGFDVDMAEALGKALGVRIEYVRTAWPRLLEDFDADRFDIAMSGISVAADRRQHGIFSTPLMRDGKTPIARCADKGRYETIADIDKPGTRVIVNPGGTNERFVRANVKNAEITTHSDNVTIFDEIIQGRADLMMTDSSETRYQQKLHPGILCAIHPDRPFDYSEKAYWLKPDAAFAAFVNHWLQGMHDDGSFERISAAWFE